ncbi:Hypothetical protein, putative [Bodo saltans]|uniref:Uncharacterized protein n=1 Tax=Bodo saltans TaxID=75058 RepID=A0A0S4JVS0_BODSA|nr:Hypothetical protein, putative [Bodo saltans]|eukprot:CUG93495.1 Hypothetical protein, putative [Bodo saltans]
MSSTEANDHLLDPRVAEEYRIAEKRFHALVSDVHLPQLDAQLFTKYFLKQKSPQRLDSLKDIVEKLESHKLATLRILKAIQERESIMQTILATADAFGRRNITTLDAQTSVLQQLYRHQQITLAIIEGVFAWRNGLTRPYPFQYKGRNYLRKIVEDCEFLDSCQLKTILPLRVAQFPLCSNISALKMFHDKKGKGDSIDGRSGKLSPVRSPSKSPRKTQHRTPASQIPPNDVDQTARLRAAESLLFAEHGLQVRVMRELLALANKRQFVTLLSTPDIVPNCATGILVSDPNWEGPLREWMQTALQRAEHDALESSSSNPSPARRAPSTGPTTAVKSSLRVEKQVSPHLAEQCTAPATVASPRTPTRSDSPASSRSPSVGSSSAATPRLNSARSAPEDSSPLPPQDREAAETSEAQPVESAEPNGSEAPASTPPAASGAGYDDEFEEDD